MDRTGLTILENNKNIQSIISVNTNILLRRFRLKFLRIMCSTSCYKKRVNFENSLYIDFLIFEVCSIISELTVPRVTRNASTSKTPCIFKIRLFSFVFFFFHVNSRCEKSCLKNTPQLPCTVNSRSLAENSYMSNFNFALEITTYCEIVLYCLQIL
jgi:hypothetical protein